MLRRFVLPAVAVTLAAPLAVTAVHASAADAGPLGLTCTAVTSPDGVDYRMCTGEIPSFDGIGLDVDLTLPGTTGSGPFPTIAMMHGWSNDKHEWESTTKDGDNADKWHWNNVWFASRNMATLTYTARGFKESCGIEDQDPNCVQSGVHLADRRWETKDTQTLLGDLVDAGVSDPSRLAASGGSYGGGQSWLLATSMPWKSAKGTTLQLAGAVPKYPWTDLAYSLAPNGRENDLAYVPADDADHTAPYGVLKESYVAGLYAVGRSSGQGRYDPADGVPDDPASNIDVNFARVQAGEPYDVDPAVQLFLADFRNKSPYYANDYMQAVKDGTVTPVPVFSIQGWTDPLFPAVETLQMYRKLKAFDPDYPVFMAFGDIGHSNAQNPPAQWHYLNEQANEFIGQNVLGQGQGTPTTTVSSLLTTCPAAATPPTVFSGTDWDALQRGDVVATAASSRVTASAAVDPTGTATDPITNGGCLQASASPTDPLTTWSWPVPASGFTELGLPRLSADYTLAGADATLAAKLWDVAPDGSKTLVTRGVYRLTTLSDGNVGRLSFELYGNCYQWQAGHQMQLEVSQADAPYLRPDNLASSIVLSNVKLDVPTTAVSANLSAP